VLSHLSLISACPKILVFLGGGDDVYTIFPCIYFMSFQGFPPLLLHLQESGRRISLIIELDELILSVHVAL
jgi:hypothetical protein